MVDRDPRSRPKRQKKKDTYAMGCWLAAIVGFVWCESVCKVVVEWL